MARPKLQLRQPLRILSIEDDPRDMELIQDLLETEDIICEVTRVDTEAALQASLEQGGIDLILADYTLPSFDGISALKLAMTACPEVPFIFVSGTLGEEVAIEALKIGATDYVLKTRLSRLVPSVIRALREARERAECKQAEENLRRSEAYLAEAQKSSHTGSFGWDVSSGEIYWSQETFRIFEYEPTAKVTIELAMQRIHPEDRPAVQQLIERVSRERTDFDFEHRLLMPDGSVKYLRVIGSPSENEDGCFEFVGAVTDITESRRAGEALRRSENYLAEAQGVTHTGSWASDGTTREALYWSEEMFRIFGFDPQQGLPMREQWLQRMHPEDRDKVKREASDRMFLQKVHSDVEYRIVLPDGTVKHIHGLAHPVFNSNGELVEVVGSAVDITEQKRAEETLREQANLLNLTNDAIFVRDENLIIKYWNRGAEKLYGWSQEEAEDQISAELLKTRFPVPIERIKAELLTNGRWEGELVRAKKDGTQVVVASRWSLQRDDKGQQVTILETNNDITERKRAEDELRTAFEEIKQLKDQLYHENVALREEIDKTSMFEEIVGISPALHAVLSRVSKVAPTDSTVLITGETGTGKELVARAIHRRSHRSVRAFVSVNCAAVPRDLIASELFGHEKGAFTGATQRRLGRFELAEGGTIFLDEVGELPAETQIALLRVLQEHEFERVGGTGSIRTNVRVIAATNRDLEAAIAAGTFRSDLFYRLNVFPIEVPPLRERREDIPVLVEYFIDRYASKAGKGIRGVNKKSLELLQSYPWPGNIRELQNVIERSVIVCDTENFSVDESWLSRQPLSSEPKTYLELARKPAAKEKEIIEAALRESGGRVYGPSGAASKLGIPRSTLESKIRSLKISKSRFKAIDSSKNS